MSRFCPHVIFRILNLIWTLGLFGALFASSQAFAKPCQTPTSIVTPSIRDGRQALWAKEKAIGFLKAKKWIPCMVIVDGERVQTELSFLGLASGQDRSLKNLTSDQIETLGALPAKMIVTASVEEGAYLKLELFKILKADQISESRSKKLRAARFPVDPEEFENQQSGFFRKAYSLLAPNTVTLGASYSQIDMVPTPEYGHVGTFIYSDVPAYLSSLSLGQVSHPDNFKDWDATIEVGARLLFFSLNQISTFQQRADSQVELDVPETSVHVYALGACSNLETVLSGYWTLGTTYISVGVGPCGYQVRQDEDPLKRFGALAVHLAAGHRAFITRQVFVYLDAANFKFSRPLYRSDFAASQDIIRFTGGIGYFFPNARMHHPSKK